MAETTFELLRSGSDLSEIILDLHRAKVGSEWAKACRTWGIEAPEVATNLEMELETARELLTPDSLVYGGQI